MNSKTIKSKLSIEDKEYRSYRQFRMIRMSGSLLWGEPRSHKIDTSKGELQRHYIQLHVVPDFAEQVAYMQGNKYLRGSTKTNHNQIKIRGQVEASQLVDLRGRCGVT